MSLIMPYLAGLEAGEQRVANLGGAYHQRAVEVCGDFSKQGLHRFLRFIEKLREQEGGFWARRCAVGGVGRGADHVGAQYRRGWSFRW